MVRKGGVPAERVLNAMKLPQLLSLIRSRRRAPIAQHSVLWWQGLRPKQSAGICCSAIIVTVGY
jgi:hypothetical protein